MNGRFSRCVAALIFSLMQHFARHNCTQRENSIHSLGSHPAFAACYTNDRCREAGQTLQISLSAHCCPWCRPQHHWFDVLSPERPLCSISGKASANAANVRNPPFLQRFDVCRVAATGLSHRTCGLANVRFLFHLAECHRDRSVQVDTEENPDFLAVYKLCTKST